MSAESQYRYNHSTKGRARNSRYEHSTKSVGRRARYALTAKRRASDHRYEATRESGSTRQKARTNVRIATAIGHPIEAKRALVVADVQIPFHDPDALEVVYRFAARWKPDTLVVNGDLADCYSFSDFDKNPVHVNRMADEIKGVCEFFGRLRRIPRKIWLGGNHEDRWRKILWRLQQYGPGANALLQSLMDAAEVGGDPDAAFRFVFGTKGTGVTYWPYGHYVSVAHDNLVITHGFRVSQHSAYSARMHLERLGRSVLIGHSHRQGVYRVTNLRGTHGAWEGGCLCSLHPEYVQFPNWNQGFATVTVEGDKFHVELIPILPGPTLHGQ